MLFITRLEHVGDSRTLHLIGIANVVSDKRYLLQCLPMVSVFFMSRFREGLSRKKIDSLKLHRLQRTIVEGVLFMFSFTMGPRLAGLSWHSLYLSSDMLYIFDAL